VNVDSRNDGSVDTTHASTGDAGSTRPRYIRFTTNVLRSLGVATDALCMLVAALITKPIYDAVSPHYVDVKLHATGAAVLALNFFLVRISRDAYSTVRGQGDDVGQGTIVDFVLATTLTAVALIQFDVMDRLSRGMLVIYAGTCVAMFFLGRIALRRVIWHLMAAGVIGQRLAIYGADAGNARRVIDLLRLERLPHLKLVGFADDRRTRIELDPIDGVHFLGGFETILDMARSGNLDQVVIALPRVGQARLDSICEQLSAAAIDVCILPREILELRATYRLNFIGELPVLRVWQQPVRDLDGLIKEVQDRVLAFLALVFLSPLLLLTALAIRLESPGPALFVQRRFGFNNLEIKVLKFRSMYQNQEDVSGAARTVRDDPRVTRIGRFIRRMSIDELPQLLNVLRGEMSLVGPRPHATAMRVGDRYYFDAVSGYSARHRVKPGITGLAQIRGLRGEIDTVERAKRRVEYDVYYIEHWSPLLDLRIILETVIQLFYPRNAF
jgi:Undecaprenyl-phosphate glucose phosphotransferase